MSHKLVSLYIGEGEYYTRTDADNVLAEKDAEIAELQETNVIIANNAVRLNKEIAELKANERRLNRLLWNARATAAKNAAGEVHNLIVCMRERHPNMTLSNTEAREREFLEKARRCRRKAREWR